MNNNKKIRNLVKGYLFRGYSPKAIRESFVKVGYSRKIVGKILNEELSRPVRFNLRFVFIFVAIFTIVLLMVSFFSGIANNCNEDMECFLEIANKCGRANGYLFFEGNKVFFQTEDCKLTKSIIQFDDHEIMELKSLLFEKEMVCMYTPNSFDPELLSFMGAIDKCHGELKDALLNIGVSQILIG